MRGLEISRPKLEDIEIINMFFEIVIRDTFEKNGISHFIDTIEEEIKDKRKFLNQDIESGGKDRFFLVAKDKEKIVATIEYGPSNDLIDTCTKGELKEVVEIGTVYVHPDYQNKGIGSQMLTSIFFKLQEKGIDEFCFDSGYKTAQKIWINKFGNPQYCLQDYWGSGEHHMVWRLRLKDVLGKNTK